MVSTPGVPGAVQFCDGAVLLGWAMIGNGQAFVGVSTLTAGAHTLTAVYGGASFAPSTSPAVRQMVAQAASTTTISATPPGQSSAGKTVTYIRRPATHGRARATPSVLSCARIWSDP